MVTLNQLIELCKNFSIKHKQLNGFSFGQNWDQGAQKADTYPLMLTNIITSAITKRGVVTRKLYIDFSDLVNKDISNKNHVLSDMELVAYDFIQYLEQIADEGDIGIMIGDNWTLTDYEEKRDDEAAGWYLEMEISCHLDGYSCNLPISPGNIFDGNYIYIGGNTQSSVCLPVTIKDQDGNVIDSVQPGGIYTVEVLTELDQKIGNTTGTIIQTIQP